MSKRSLWLASLALLCLSVAALAQEMPVIHNLRFPDLNPDATKVTFSYQGDIWVADLDAEQSGVARRLTVHAAYDSRPRFSPDGATIAFMSDRYGGADIFTIPSTGGDVKRVTFHSAADLLADWSPDGKRLLFYAGGREHRYTAPYELELETGYVHALLRDGRSVTGRSYSPDGRYLYGEMGGVDWTRKGYRGSANSNVLQYDLQADTVRMLTDFEGDDNWALCSGDGAEVYYVTERFGRPNLVAQNIESGAIRQITHHGDDQVSFPTLSGDGKWLCYECDFEVWKVDVRGGVPRKLVIRAPIDYPENFEAEETATAGIAEMEVNRDGTWAAVRVFDDIFLVRPDFRNGSIRITDWPGFDGDFFWHPDGKRLYFVSQKNRTGDIWEYNVETKESKCVLEDDRYYLEIMGMAPDGERAFLRRNAGGDGVFQFSPDTGQWSQLLEEPGVAGIDISPDGKWIAAEIDHTKSGQDVYIRPAEGGEWTNVTKTPKGNSEPRWSPDGKKLLFISARSGSRQFYAIDLERPPVKFDDYEAQFQAEADKKRKADEDKAKAEEQKKQAAEKAQNGQAAAPEKPAEPPWPEWKPKPIDPIAIDLTRIDQRAKRLTTSNVNESPVGWTADRNGIIFLRGGQVWTMDLEGENQRQLLPGDHSFGAARVTTDGKWLFYVENGKLFRADISRGGGSGSEVSFKAELDKDARTVQKWAFQQAWALLDERFYSRDLHGVDWKAVYDRYVEQCTGTLVREDFCVLVSKMFGELNASHLGCSAGSRGGKDTARLGLVPDPAYRGPGIKVESVMVFGPVDQPEATVQAGEYILAIDGHDVSLTEGIYELLADKAGERVKLTVNGQPTKEGAREISVKPISSGELGNLQYRDWVEGNRELAKRLSDGRVYYTHMSGMNAGTLAQLQEEIAGQAQLYDAIIIDVRNNGGGNTHDSVIDILSRKAHGWDGARGTPLRTSPFPQFNGPMIVLINQSSASDAEIFPNGFRERGLGKLVGVPTAGAVIGTSDQPLINGCTFRVPWVGWYRMDGVDLENLGVKPDIPVALTYADYRAGRDPQMEAAVTELLAELAAKPKPAQPEYDGHPLSKP